MILIYILRENIFTLVLPLLSQKYALKYLKIENTNAYNMLYLLISFAIFSFILVKERTASITIKGMRNILLFALFIQIFASINTIVMRMGYYYLLFIPLLIPMVIRYGQRFNKEVLLCVHLVLIVFFTGYFFFNANYGADILNLYPYEFFWD